MTQKQTIAIVGASEKIGWAIAKSLSKGPYRLILMAKEGGLAASLKSQLLEQGSTADIEANDCAKEASWEADIIIVATPYEDEREVAEKIREVATGKIVISVSNPITPLYNSVVGSSDTSAAEALQKLLPYSKIVKTFNTAFASDLVSPAIEGKTGDTFIAGNNRDAVETVSEVIRSCGFNPIVVGDLSVSRKLETIPFYRSK